MTDYVHKTEFPGFYSRFKVGDKVKFRDPEFEDDKVHTVKKVDVETLNGHPWKIRIELENGVRRYDDHFILANAARSRNASRNAKFKVGDEVRVGNPHLADRGRYGRVVSAGVDGNPLLYDVDLGGGVQLFSESDLVVANTRPRNAKFKVGDKVKLIGVSPLREDFNSGIGKVTKVMERGNGAAYHVLFDGGREFPFVESQLVAANASRSTNAVVAKALNASRVARNERVDEATGRRDIEQSLRKMAELAARVSHAKATSKATHDDYSFAGYIDLAFPDKGAADNFNPYDVIYALRDARSLVPKWAWGVGGFNYERKGNLWRIRIGRFAT